MKPLTVLYESAWDFNSLNWTFKYKTTHSLNSTLNIFILLIKIFLFWYILFSLSPVAGVRTAELRGVRGRRLPHLHGLEGQPHRRLQRPRPAHRLEDDDDDDDADDDSDTEVGNITNILLNTLLPRAASPQCSVARGAVSGPARQS